MTNSNIFKAAHKIASHYTGDYRACFKLALKEVRDTLTIANRLYENDWCGTFDEALNEASKLVMVIQMMNNDNVVEFCFEAYAKTEMVDLFRNARGTNAKLRRCKNGSLTVLYKDIDKDTYRQFHVEHFMYLGHYFELSNGSFAKVCKETGELIMSVAA